MKSNENQEIENKFLDLYVKEGKSIPTIAEVLGVEIEFAYDLKEELELEIIDLKSREYDKIVQQFGLSYLDQFKYFAELHKRLKVELDKRDFTGLPTDKLYAILMDVQENINSRIEFMSNIEDFDDDYLDDFNDDNHEH